MYMVEGLLFSIWTNRFPSAQYAKPHVQTHTCTHADIRYLLRYTVHCTYWHSLSHIHTNTHTAPPSQQPTHVSHILTRVGLAPGESSLELPLRNQIHFIKLPDVTTNPLPLDAAFTRQQHRDTEPAGADVVTRTQNKTDWERHTSAHFTHVHYLWLCLKQCTRVSIHNKTLLYTCAPHFEALTCTFALLCQSIHINAHYKHT